MKATDPGVLALRIDSMAQVYDKALKGKRVDIVRRFPNVVDYKRVTLGAFQWTIDDKPGWRLIRRGADVAMPYGISTPSGVARDYLSSVYPKRLRATANQAREITRHRATPLHARASHLADACYVDLSAAYWSLMMLVGWNVDYFPGHWLVPGRAPADFPMPSDKVARNCLVSAGLPLTLKVWANGRLSMSPVSNKHINMGLWALVQDVLHAIAYQAIMLGATYVHTDGYILPTVAAPTLLGYIERLGLVGRIKHQGEAWVWGPSSYQVGPHRSKRWGSYKLRPYSNIQWPQHEGWLLSSLARCMDGAAYRVYERSMVVYDK